MSYLGQLVASFDAVVQQTKLRTIAIDAAVEVLGVELTTSYDARVVDSIALATSIDAAVQASLSLTAAIDAIIQGGTARNVSYDAVVLKSLTRSLSVDAKVLAPKYIFVDAAVRKMGAVQQVAMDACIVTEHGKWECPGSWQDDWVHEESLEIGSED